MRWFKASGLVFSAVFLLASLLIFVVRPLSNARGHAANRPDDWASKWIYETSEIYAVLKSHAVNLNERAMRELAGTIWEESMRQSLDPMLVLAVIKVESEFRPAAISTQGARGLMQIRPFVAASLAEEAELDDWEEENNLHDPVINVKLGTFYLGRLFRQFRDLQIALAAYHAGPFKVTQILKNNQAVQSNYAQKVLSTYAAYRPNTPDEQIPQAGFGF